MFISSYLLKIIPYSQIFFEVVFRILGSPMVGLSTNKFGGILVKISTIYLFPKRAKK